MPRASTSLQRIKTVLFDLGGVACHFHPQRRLTALAAASPLSADEIRATIWESGFDAECDRGRYAASEIYALLRRRLGLALRYDELLSAWVSAFEPNPAALALADQLAPRYQLALLSNNGPLLREALPTFLPEIARRFDLRLFSCDLGHLKPEPALFQAVETRLGQPSQELLLLDDEARNVEAALGEGWQALQIRNATDLARAGALLA